MFFYKHSIDYQKLNNKIIEVLETFKEIKSISFDFKQDNVNLVLNTHNIFHSLGLNRLNLKEDKNIQKIILISKQIK